MRSGLLIIALVALLGLTSCGGGDDEPLTGSEYRAAGNELCAAWADEVSALASGLPNNPSQQDLFDVADETASVGDDYMKQLLDLGTPESLAADRAALQARLDEFEVLIENAPQTEAEVEAITAAGNAITDVLGTIWSTCRPR